MYYANTEYESTISTKNCDASARARYKLDKTRTKDSFETARCKGLRHFIRIGKSVSKLGGVISSLSNGVSFFSPYDEVYY